METCKTCQFWRFARAQEDWNAGEYGIFPCDPVTYEPAATLEAVRARWGYLVAYCVHPKLLFYQRPAQDAAAVYDGSGYDGTLITGEDFGCRLHTPREP